MADAATKINHESCYYVWQFPTNFKSNISSEQFGAEHLKWKLEYIADDLGHLYLHLLSAPFNTIVVRYGIELTNSFEKALTEADVRNLKIPSNGIYEIIWHDVSQNFALIFSSSISSIFSHRQAIILNFKEYVTQRNKSKDETMNLIINVKAECKEFQQNGNDGKLNYGVKSSISVYNIQANKLLTSMLQDSNFADLTLKLGSSNFKVHKSILGSISPVFRALLLDKKNCKDIQIKDISEDALKILINFLYTGIVLIPDYQTCLELLKASEIYGIQNLKVSCAEYLIKELNHVNIIEILLNAELYNASNLKEYALEFFLKNIKKYGVSDFEEITRLKPSLLPILCSRMSEMYADLVAQTTTKRKRKK